MIQPEIVIDAEAEFLLGDSVFRQKWDALFKLCPWATVFQSFIFADTWYGVYRDEYSLIFVTEKDVNEELIGLLTLVREKSTGKLFHIGTYHAEYQGWLATAENGNGFITAALEKLRLEYPNDSLHLMFLSPNSPVGWLNGKSQVTRQCVLRTHLRPLIDLDETQKFEESFKKKNNKNRLRQLRKYGDVRTERIKCSHELKSVFDQIERYSKLRISALHNVAPRLEKKRKDFHIALIDKAKLLEISVLKAGDVFASAQMIIKNGREKLLATTAMSPFLASHSPSRMHIAMLAIEFSSEDDIDCFDLSPGEGYKELLATRTEPIHSADIFFSNKDFRRHNLQQKIRSSAKNILERFEITKSNAYETVDGLFHKMNAINYSKLPGNLAGLASRSAYEKKEIRVYAYDAKKAALLQDPGMMNKDSVEDLLKYESTESWQLTRSKFHQGVLNRFEKGIHSFTFSEGDKLLHYGWLLKRQEESDVYEVGQKFKLPPDSAVLFDYYTHPDARGRGLYKNSLLQGLSEAAKIPGTKQIFISVLADNKSSRHVIEKLGFEYQGSLFRKNVFGNVSKWQEWVLPETLKANSAPSVSSDVLPA